MTSNHSDQAPIHSVPDAAVNLQCGGAPPSPPDLGTSQVLPQPVSPPSPLRREGLPPKRNQHDPPTTGPTVSNQDQETKVRLLPVGWSRISDVICIGRRWYNGSRARGVGSPTSSGACVPYFHPPILITTPQDGGPVPEQSEGSAVSHWVRPFPPLPSSG